MTTKRISIALSIIILVGLTGVKVGALWPLQQAAVTPEPAPAPVKFAPSAVPHRPPLKPADLALLERLNHRLQGNPGDYEASLLKGLLLFQLGALDAAIDELRGLTERAPKFQLAHLILGDLLSARFDRLDSIGSASVEKAVAALHRQRIVQLQSEARARLQGYLSLVDGDKIPRHLITLGDNVSYALLVDKSKNRLYVYRNSGPGLPPELVSDFYIVLGKKTGDKLREGDMRTPNGVYFVTGYLPDEKLPPLYGSGAFPVNYPNELDRRLRKSGSGIWLHGTDKSLYSRPPLDSEGCVVLTNEEFSRVARYIKADRTPVIITETVEWISSREWLDLNIELQAALETWRMRWEEAELDPYLGAYSTDFWTRNYDYEHWKNYKKLVFYGKRYQKIDVSNLSLFDYPRAEQERPMVVANFDQHYHSNNFNGDMRKRLYLVKEQNEWKILYEGRQ